MASFSKARRSGIELRAPKEFYGRFPADTPELRALWKRYLSDRRRADLDQLTIHYLPVVRMIAVNRARSKPDFYRDSIDEMTSDGTIGLIRAIELAEYSDQRFTAYLNRWVRVLMAREQSRRNALISPPMRQSPVAAAQATYIQEHGRLPTPQELADRIGISNPNIQIGNAPSVSRFSEMANDDGTNVRQFADPNVEMPYQQMFDRETMKLALKGMDRSDQKLFKRLLKGDRPAHVAVDLGLTRQRICQRMNGLLWQARKRADLARHLDVEPDTSNVRLTGNVPSIFSAPPARRIA